MCDLSAVSSYCAVFFVFWYQALLTFWEELGSLSFSRCFGAVRIALRMIKCSQYLKHLKNTWLEHGLGFLQLAAFSMCKDYFVSVGFFPSCINFDNAKLKLYFPGKSYIFATYSNILEQSCTKFFQLISSASIIKPFSFPLIFYYTRK